MKRTSWKTALCCGLALTLSSMSLFAVGAADEKGKGKAPADSQAGGRGGNKGGDKPQADKGGDNQGGDKPQADKGGQRGGDKPQPLVICSKS